ncbi:MAG: PIN domain-containing protein [Gemmatimonadota bacterium]
MDRVFLDANVLFSAAYREDAGLKRLWDLGDVELLTSEYALEEARRNLTDANARARLARLVEDVELVAEASDVGVPDDHSDLPDKDRPILAAALAARATHLITGDLTHFGPLYGRDASGVVVLPPAMYLHMREDDE